MRTITFNNSILQNLILVGIFFVITQNTLAQTNYTIEIHSSVGKEIDKEEKERFGLFNFYQNKIFKNAIVYQINDSIVVEINSINDSLQYFLLTENELKIEIRKIENAKIDKEKKTKIADDFSYKEVNKVPENDFSKYRELVVLHPALGNTIEQNEKIKYNLLEVIPNSAFSSAKLYKQNNYHFFEITKSDSTKSLQYLSEKDILAEFKKVSMYNHGFDKIKQENFKPSKMYLSASTTFYSANLVNSYYLDNKLQRKEFANKMNERLNFNANIGFQISGSSSLEVGLNLSKVLKNEMLIDTNYAAYFITSQTSNYTFSAEIFDVNNKTVYASTLSNWGLSVGLKSYIGKKNFIKTYIKNTFVCNFYNSAHIFINDQTIYRRKANSLIYTEKSLTVFNSGKFGFNFMSLNGLGGEIIVLEGVALYLDLQFQYIGGKIENKDGSPEGVQTKFFKYNTFNFAPNLGFQISL